MPRIYFTNFDREITCRAGETLLQAALDEGLEVNHVCGGNARCTTCCVRVVQGMHNLSPVGPEEEYMKDARSLSESMRLACQAEVVGDLTVEYVGVEGR